MIEIDQGRALLRAEQGSCSGCVGCAGRCSLLLGGETEISVALTDISGQLRVDDWARLSMHASTLRNEALLGYGLPLAGLLLGAVLGFLVAAPLGWQANFCTAVAAIAGTLLSLSLSKRHAKAVLRVWPESSNG